MLSQISSLPALKASDVTQLCTISKQAVELGKAGSDRSGFWVLHYVVTAWSVCCNKAKGIGMDLKWYQHCQRSVSYKIVWLLSVFKKNHRIETSTLSWYWSKAISSLLGV